jgi:hypothetical protein
MARIDVCTLDPLHFDQVLALLAANGLPLDGTLLRLPRLPAHRPQ